MRSLSMLVAMLVILVGSADCQRLRSVSDMGVPWRVVNGDTLIYDASAAAPADPSKSTVRDTAAAWTLLSSVTRQLVYTQAEKDSLLQALWPTPEATPAGGWDLEIDAVVYSGTDTAAIRNRIETAFPDYNIRLNLMPYDPDAVYWLDGGGSSTVGVDGKTRSPVFNNRIQGAAYVDSVTSLMNRSGTVFRLPSLTYVVSNASLAFQLGSASAQLKADYIASLVSDPRGQYVVDNDYRPGSIELLWMPHCPYGQEAFKQLVAWIETHPEAPQILDLVYILGYSESDKVFSSLFGQDEINEATFQKYLAADGEKLELLVDKRSRLGRNSTLVAVMADTVGGMLMNDYMAFASNADSIAKYTKSLVLDARRSRRMNVTASPTFLLDGKWLTSAAGLEQWPAFEGFSATLGAQGASCRGQ